MDSSRLPGKSLLYLGDEPLVFRVMEALNNVDCDIRILACPEDSAAVFAPLAERAGFQLFPGPKEDVLSRFFLAVEHFGAERIIRATADNPFVFTDAANQLVKETAALNADYGLYLGTPHGSGVECVSGEALLRAGREALSPAEREHVCPYLYNNPGIFRLHRPLAPLQWQAPELKCTIDTMSD
jgi:spore coat polysaccharide biosynthesis protein SpsF